MLQVLVCLVLKSSFPIYNHLPLTVWSSSSLNFLRFFCLFAFFKLPILTCLSSYQVAVTCVFDFSIFREDKFENAFVVKFVFAFETLSLKKMYFCVVEKMWYLGCKPSSESRLPWRILLWERKCIHSL